MTWHFLVNLITFLIININDGKKLDLAMIYSIWLIFYNIYEKLRFTPVGIGFVIDSGFFFDRMITILNI